MSVPWDVYTDVVLPYADFGTLYLYRNQPDVRELFEARLREADFGTLYPYRDLPEVQERYEWRLYHDDPIELMLVAIDNDDLELFWNVAQRVAAERRYQTRGGQIGWVDDLVHVILNTEASTPRLFAWLLEIAQQRTTDPLLGALRYATVGHIMLDRCLVQRYRDQEPQRTELESILIRDLTITQSEIVERAQRYLKQLEQDDPRARTSIRGPFQWLSSFLNLSDLAIPDIGQTLPPRARVGPEQRQVYQELYDRMYTLLYRRRDSAFDKIACLTDGVGLTDGDGDNGLVSIWHRRLFGVDDYRLALQVLRDPMRYDEIARMMVAGEIGVEDYLHFVGYQIVDPEAWVDALLRTNYPTLVRLVGAVLFRIARELRQQGETQRELAAALDDLDDLLTQKSRR